MNNVRWQGVLSGAVAFLAAHCLEWLQWTRWFADQSLVAWFTNSGRAVVVTMAFMFVAGLVAGGSTTDRRERMPAVVSVSLGGIVAMIATLLVTGAGSIGPLVVIIGGALLIAGALAGVVTSQQLGAATRTR